MYSKHKVENQFGGEKMSIFPLSSFKTWCILVKLNSVMLNFFYSRYYNDNFQDDWNIWHWSATWGGVHHPMKAQKHNDGLGKGDKVY